MKIILIVALVAFAASLSYTRAQDESEGRSVPSRGLLKRGLAKGKPSTTTTTIPPPPQEEPEYEDYAADEPQEPSTETPPSSTEGKKLVTGGVRPFRSNTDLLETLKKRRAQAVEAKTHSHPTALASSFSQDSPTESGSKTSYSNKKRFNTPARDTNNEEAPAQAKPSRSRFGRPVSSRSVHEPAPEEQNEAPVRTGRGFRRGGN